MNRPWVIGITGGIASGKSAVTNFLENRGALALRADRIGHEILESPVVQPKLVRPVSYTHLTLPTNREV